MKYMGERRNTRVQWTETDNDYDDVNDNDITIISEIDNFWKKTTTTTKEEKYNERKKRKIKCCIAEIRFASSPPNTHTTVMP